MITHPVSRLLVVSRLVAVSALGVVLAGAAAGAAQRAEKGDVPLPGATMARGEVRAAVLECLSVHEELDKSGCRSRHVVDTKIADDRMLPLSWTEEWQVYRCGRVVTYRVFCAVSGGATRFIEVSGGTAGNWVVASDGKGNLVRFDGGTSRDSLLAREMGNLVANGSFEDGHPRPAVWELSGPARLSSDGRSESRCAHVAVSPPAEGGQMGQRGSVRQKVEGIRPNENVQVSFWMKTRDSWLHQGKSKKAKMFLEVKKSDGGSDWPTVGEMEGTNDWRRISKEVWIAGNMTEVWMNLDSEESHGEAWFDDIVVTRKPEYIADAWAKIWAGWHPEWASQGPKLVLVEDERKMIAESGRSRLSYRVDSSGFPRDKKFRVWVKRMDDDPVMIACLGEYHVDEKGRLVSNVGGRLDRCRFYAGNYLNGQAFEVAAIATGQDVSAFAEAFPFPIEAESEYEKPGGSGTGKCRLWLEMTSVTANAFRLYGKGYEANEELDVATQAKGGPIDWKTMKASWDGSFETDVKPVLPGSAGGDAIVTVNGKNCRLYLVHAWGTKALEETSGLLK